MKLNRERILTIRSLRLSGVWDFTLFWAQRKEFIEMVNPSGHLREEFFDTEEERILGSVVCKFLDDNLSPAKFTPYIENGELLIPQNSLLLGKYHKKAVVLGTTLTRKYAQLQQELSNNRKYTVGLIALYKMLGKEFESKFDVPQCLGALGVIDTAKPLIYLKEGIALETSEEIAYPLSTKPIVNISETRITVKAGKQTVELNKGECVIGVFHQDKCYKLLPKDGKNDHTELSFQFDPKAQCTCLHIKDIRKDKTEDITEVIKNVISFYIDKYGYAYVMENGEVRISDIDRANMYPLISFLRFNPHKDIIEITCKNEDDYDILCKTI
ncbi:hypothetical protein [Bacteroides fluxus]|jgi:hypothetical protein